MFIPHLWLAVFIFSTKLSSFATAPKARIILYYFTPCTRFSEKAQTRISRLPFAVNAILKISLISPSHGQTNKCEIPLHRGVKLYDVAILFFGYDVIVSDYVTSTPPPGDVTIQILDDEDVIGSDDVSLRL